MVKERGREKESDENQKSGTHTWPMAHVVCQSRTMYISHELCLRESEVRHPHATCAHTPRMAHVYVCDDSVKIHVHGMARTRVCPNSCVCPT